MHTDINHEIQSELQEINQNEIFKVVGYAKTGGGRRKEK
jgi:hypothetical protein